MATRACYEAQDPDLKAAALLYVEYLRGLCQSIGDGSALVAVVRGAAGGPGELLRVELYSFEPSIRKSP